MEPVLEVDAIVTRFGADSIHNNLAFSVGRGQLVALIGGSGTGKSVLLKEIVGLQRPTAGSIRMLGVDVWRADARAMKGLRGRFGMLFQDGALFSSLSGGGN